MAPCEDHARLSRLLELESNKEGSEISQCDYSDCVPANNARDWERRKKNRSPGHVVVPLHSRVTPRDVCRPHVAGPFLIRPSPEMCCPANQGPSPVALDGDTEGTTAGKAPSIDGESGPIAGRFRQRHRGDDRGVAASADGESGPIAGRFRRRHRGDDRGVAASVDGESGPIAGRFRRRDRSDDRGVAA